jgi:hypothetical protein
MMTLMRRGIPVAVLVVLGCWWQLRPNSPEVGSPLPAPARPSQSATEPSARPSAASVPEPGPSGQRELAGAAQEPTELAPPRWALADPQGLAYVTGRFLLPPEFERMDITLGIRWPRTLAGDWNDRISYQLEVDAEGAFRFDGVPAGSCQVYAQYGDDYLRRDLEQVEVRVAEHGEARAGAIDLRSRLWLARVHVTDERGEPIPGAVGIHNPPIHQEIEIQDGHAEVTVHSATDTAWFVAPGRRAVRVDDLLDGTEVVLERAPIQQIRVRNPELLPRAPWHLSLQLHADPPPLDGRLPLDFLHSPRVRVPADGAVHIPVSLPQHSRLSYALERDGAPGEPEIVRPVEACGDLVELDVAAAGGTAQLELDPELVAAALERASDS